MSEKAIERATHHPDKPGAGAAKRRDLPQNERGSAVMKEFSKGTLRSGSGEHVTNPAQARAIAVSESGTAKDNIYKGRVV